MTPKKKRVLMIRRHVSAPEWLWSGIEELAEVDGRSTSELVRRLLLAHLRAVDPEGLPRPQRIASYKRASRSLEGAGSARKRKSRK